jgi:hypothetical protein
MRRVTILRRLLRLSESVAKPEQRPQHREAANASR